MPDLQPNLDRFNRELNQLQQLLAGWQEELTVRETQIAKDTETVKRQREELITKSNLILEQVNGLRGQKEAADQKILEAQKLRQSAISQMEEADKRLAQASLKEKNSKDVEEREKQINLQLQVVETERMELQKEQSLLQKEQILLDEKQQALVIRENRIALSEARQKRVMSDL